MLVILEGLILSFWLLLICVAGIAKITKWVGTCIGYPVLAAVMSGIMHLMSFLLPHRLLP